MIYFPAMLARARASAWLHRAIPYLALTVFSLVVAEPLARGMGACTDDAALHLARAVEIERLIRLGHWLPRWQPDLAHGFGYPLFNYYAPLSTNLLVAVHALGFNYDAALHVVYFIALLGSALATFALARDLWDESAGMVAAVGYLSAPYFAFDILFRGALAESFAWVWPPLILWAMHRALARRSLGWGLTSAAAFAALLLAHNTLALIAAPLVVGFGLLLAVDALDLRDLRLELRARRPVILLLAGSLLMGLALSAFFWLPALAERNLVQADRLLVPPIFTYYTNFITPAELLAAPRPDDPAFINPSPARALGWVPALLALPAPLLAVARRRLDPDARRVIFFSLALAVYAAMTLEFSRPAWDNLPLLPFVQFPWRMLSLAALCASLLAGAGVHLLSDAVARRRGGQHETAMPRARGALASWGGVAIAGALLLANLPWWYPRYCSNWGEHDLASAVRYEYATDTLGTTAKGEFLPATVRLIPEDDSLAEALLAGDEPKRVDESRLPPGARIEYESLDPLDTRFVVRSPQGFRLTYRTFFFPGWEVWLDGRPAPITVTADNGLISFDVPAGESRVRVRFGSTPIRTAASAVSAVAAIAFVGFATLAWKRGRQEGSAFAGQAPRWPNRRTALLLIPTILLTLKIGVIDRLPNPLRRTAFDGQAVAGLQSPLRADYAGGISLHGFDLSRSGVASGLSLDVALYVSVREHTERRFQPTFSLEDDAGTVWSAAEQFVPRWHREPPPTPLWPPAPEAYARWARQVAVLPGTPPGRYLLWATIFDLDTLQPDSILDENGNAVAPRLLLAEVEVERPERPPDPADLSPQIALDRSTGGALTLIGFSADRAEARPGDGVTLTAFWRADSPPSGDESLTLTLNAADGATARRWDLEVSPNLPMAQWRAGDVWRAVYAIVLPASLESGAYRWSVAVSGGPPIALSEIRLTAPTHSWSPPAVQVADDVQFGEIARLAGHRVESSPTLSVTLVWQSQAETSTSYSVFVHIADASGRIVAQSDGVPANHDRPTTGWLPGEFVADRHDLPPLPPGEYSILVGLYDPRTGDRLPPSGPGADDARRLLLGSLEVGP